MPRRLVLLPDTGEFVWESAFRVSVRKSMTKSRQASFQISCAERKKDETIASLHVQKRKTTEVFLHERHKVEQELMSLQAYKHACKKFDVGVATAKFKQQPPCQKHMPSSELKRRTSQKLAWADRDRSPPRQKIPKRMDNKADEDLKHMSKYVQSKDIFTVSHDSFEGLADNKSLSTISESDENIQIASTAHVISEQTANGEHRTAKSSNNGSNDVAKTAILKESMHDGHLEIGMDSLHKLTESLLPDDFHSMANGATRNTDEEGLASSIPGSETLRHREDPDMSNQADEDFEQEFGAMNLTYSREELDYMKFKAAACDPNLFQFRLFKPAKDKSVKDTTETVYYGMDGAPLERRLKVWERPLAGGKKESRVYPKNCRNTTALRRATWEEAGKLMHVWSPENVRKNKARVIKDSLNLPQIVDRKRTTSAIFREYQSYRQGHPGGMGCYGKTSSHDLDADVQVRPRLYTMA